MRETAVKFPMYRVFSFALTFFRNANTAGRKLHSEIETPHGSEHLDKCASWENTQNENSMKNERSRCLAVQIYISPLFEEREMVLTTLSDKCNFFHPFIRMLTCVPNKSYPSCIFNVIN